MLALCLLLATVVRSQGYAKVAVLGRDVVYVRLEETQSEFSVCLWLRGRVLKVMVRCCYHIAMSVISRT